MPELMAGSPVGPSQPRPIVAGDLALTNILAQRVDSRATDYRLSVE